jgi:tetratricopeptide (TPR) repeat protein
MSLTAKVVLALACLPAIQPLPGQTATAPGGSSSTSSTRGATSTQSQTSAGVPQGMPEQPLFLSGRVVLDDGTPAPIPVELESVCNGNVRAEGYATPNGSFAFELGGRRNSSLPDASMGSSSDTFPESSFQSTGSTALAALAASPRRLQNCQVRARLPGYRSDVIPLFTRRATDSPDVGLIVLHRIEAVEGSLVSVTSLAAPKDAEKAYSKGREALQRGKLDEARKNLEAATRLYPNYAAAWSELGKTLTLQKREQEAREAFRKSIQADGKYIDPYIQLAALQAAARQWQELLESSATAIRLDPFDYPVAHFLHAIAHYNLQSMETAEKSAREAVRLDAAARTPRARHLLGLILAARGEYGEAAEQLRAYLTLAPSAADAGRVRGQLAQFEGLASSKPQPR